MSGELGQAQDAKVAENAVHIIPDVVESSKVADAPKVEPLVEDAPKAETSTEAVKPIVETAPTVKVPLTDAHKEILNNIINSGEGAEDIQKALAMAMKSHTLQNDVKIKPTEIPEPVVTKSEAPTVTPAEVKAVENAPTEPVKPEVPKASEPSQKIPVYGEIPKVEKPVPAIIRSADKAATGFANKYAEVHRAGGLDAENIIRQAEGKRGFINREADDATAEIFGNTTMPERHYIVAKSQGLDTDDIMQTLQNATHTPKDEAVQPFKDFKLTPERMTELDNKADALRQEMRTMDEHQQAANTIADEKVFNPDVYFPMYGKTNWHLPGMGERDEDVKDFLMNFRNAAPSTVWNSRKGTQGLNAPSRAYNTLLDAVDSGKLNLDEFDPSRQFFQHKNKVYQNINSEELYKNLADNTDLVKPVDFFHPQTKEYLGSGAEGHEQATNVAKEMYKQDVKAQAERLSQEPLEYGNDVAPVPSTTQRGGFTPLEIPSVADRVRNMRQVQNPRHLINSKDEAGLQTGSNVLKHHSMDKSLVDMITKDTGRSLQNGSVWDNWIGLNSAQRTLTVASPVMHVMINLPLNYLASGGTMKNLALVMGKAIGNTAAEKVVGRKLTNKDWLTNEKWHQLAEKDGAHASMSRMGSDLKTIGKRMEPVDLKNAPGKLTRGTMNGLNDFTFQNMESKFATALYKSLVEKGERGADAGRKVRKALGDYTNRTDLERLNLLNFSSWLRTIIPLYTKIAPKVGRAERNLMEYNDQSGDPNANPDNVFNRTKPWQLYVGNLPLAKEHGIDYINVTGPHKILNHIDKLAHGDPSLITNHFNFVTSSFMKWVLTQMGEEKQPGKDGDFNTLYNKNAPGDVKAKQAASSLLENFAGPTIGQAVKIASPKSSDFKKKEALVEGLTGVKIVDKDNDTEMKKRAYSKRQALMRKFHMRGEMFNNDTLREAGNDQAEELDNMNDSQ